MAQKFHVIEKLDTGEALIMHPFRGSDVGVKLTSGMVHWFRNEMEARQSNYWPSCHSIEIGS